MLTDAVLSRLSETSDADLAELGDPAPIAERMAALIPSPHPYNRDIGPFYDTSALTRWLGVRRQALDQRVRSRSLLGCPTDGGQRVYPVWQFRPDGSTIPRLAEVLAELSKGTEDRWTWASWLAARVPGLHDGVAAYQWLASERDPKVIIDEARADAARWAV